MAEDENIGTWIGFLSEKSLTKSLRRDVSTILAKKLAEKETTSKQGKGKSEKTYPPEDND